MINSKTGLRIIFEIRQKNKAFSMASAIYLRFSKTINGQATSESSKFCRKVCCHEYG